MNSRIELIIFASYYVNLIEQIPIVNTSLDNLIMFRSLVYAGVHYVCIHKLAIEYSIYDKETKAKFSFSDFCNNFVSILTPMLAYSKRITPYI